MRKRVRLTATYLNYVQGTFPSDRHSLIIKCVLPVTFVLTRFRSFIPTGRCHCVMSPARRIARRSGKREEERWKGEEGNVRNEEACGWPP